MRLSSYVAILSVLELVSRGDHYGGLQQGIDSQGKIGTPLSALFE